MNSSDIKCWLYVRVNSKTEGKIFTGQDAIDVALAEGWKTTPAAFLDEVDGITESQKEVARDIISMYDADANLLANVDSIEDLDMIKEAYERLTGKPMDSRVKKLSAARNIVRKLMSK